LKTNNSARAVCARLYVPVTMMCDSQECVASMSFMAIEIHNTINE
jgi:hypothetical protein